MHQQRFMLIRQTAQTFAVFKPNMSRSNKKEQDLQQRKSHVGTGQTTLGCRKQPADSQTRSYRERRCSRKTRGPPPASLLSSQSPSSPRRRSSEGEEARRRRKSREEEEAEKRKVRPALQSSTTDKQTSSCQKTLYEKQSEAQCLHLKVLRQSS